MSRKALGNYPEGDARVLRRTRLLPLPSLSPLSLSPCACLSQLCPLSLLLKCTKTSITSKTHEETEEAHTGVPRNTALASAPVPGTELCNSLQFLGDGDVLSSDVAPLGRSLESLGGGLATRKTLREASALGLQLHA